MQFQNKASISTGAASGMGLLFSQCWAAEGGNVLMCDVNEAVLAEKVAEINAKGGSPTTVLRFIIAVYIDSVYT